MLARQTVPISHFAPGGIFLRMEAALVRASTILEYFPKNPLPVPKIAAA
jgi:hypothetical protein